MKLTYLGTAAAEGFPAIFCNCKYCREARSLGGKNIRTRSQSLINDDLLIDIPADTYHHFLNNNIEGDKIKYLLITHSHSDHLYTKEFSNRHGAYAHNMRTPTLKVICSAGTFKAINREYENIEFIIIKAYETVTVGDYKITALPARHMLESEAFIYIIQADKTILYAHDTGIFFDEVFEYIKNSKLVFDMISFDCTNVNIPSSGLGSHMGFMNIKGVLKTLKKYGSVDDKTICYVNHFSHNGNPIHDKLCKDASKIGCLVSYDGCTVEI